MSRNFAVLKPLKEEAKRIGNKTFLADTPCPKCGSYEIYTNQKGYVCVGCHLNKKKLHAEKNIEAIRQQRRESYNRNRPNHNPEKFVFDGVKRAGVYEAGAITQAEFDKVKQLLSLVKESNGTGKALYTVDHDLPASGIIINGQKIVGRTVLKNLRPLTIEMNKAKSNMYNTDNFKYDQEAHVIINDDVTLCDALSSTEQMRKIFFDKWGVVTKQNSTYQKKLDDGTITITDKKGKDSISQYELFRKYLVLELMLGGFPDKYLFNEAYPLPDVWDDDKNKYVKPIIKADPKLYSRETLAKMYGAIRWMDLVIDCLHWKQKGLKVSPLFDESDFIQRIEEHFIQWVNNWSSNRNSMKMIDDFLDLPSKQEREDFKNAHFLRMDSGYIPPENKITVSSDKIKVITRSQAADLLEFFNHEGYTVVDDELYYQLPTTPYFYRFM
ncbi:TPA: hypothetical protein ACGH17_004558 [Salmonella enterica subsp. enterica serovar Anatum]